ncbi:MAG: hypothetical protein L0Y39_03355 [Methylococcaceae bacterium]|nr:hypothetical protein [Methylococcaceae bacterium]
MLRYCARLVFASERLQWIETGQRLVYSLRKPKPEAGKPFSISHLWSFWISSPSRFDHRASIDIVIAWRPGTDYFAGIEDSIYPEPFPFGVVGIKAV